MTYFINPLAPVYGSIKENFKGPKKNYHLRQLFKFDLNFETVQWKTIYTKEGQGGYGKGESVYLLMMYFADEGTDMTTINSFDSVK